MKPRHITSGALAALCVLALVSAPVAAQSDGDFWAGLSEDDEPGLGVQVGAWLADQTSGIARRFAQLGEYIGDNEQRNASLYADDFREAFNDDAGDLAAYASERVTPSTSYDVYRVNFSDRDGGSATVFVVATVSNGTFTDAEALTPSAFEQRNRTVDHTVTADWYVSRNAADELEAFVADYASPDKNVSASYYAKMKAQYGSGLESTLWGGA